MQNASQCRSLSGTMAARYGGRSAPLWQFACGVSVRRGRARAIPTLHPAPRRGRRRTRESDDHRDDLAAQLASDAVGDARYRHARFALPDDDVIVLAPRRCACA